MNEHDTIQKAFSDLHASDQTFRNVMRRVHCGKGAKVIPKRFVVMAAVLAALFSMALVVHGSKFVLQADLSAFLTPAKDPGQVIDDAFGDNISTQKPEMFDAYGNPIELPDMERPALDLTEAEKLFGSYISDVDAVVSVGESTFTLNNFLIDETGVGAVTWTVENPNGITYLDSGYGFVCFDWSKDPFCEPWIEHVGADGQKKISTHHSTALVSKNEDNTVLDLVTYFGTFDHYEIGDHFVWNVSRTADTGRQTVQITPVSHIPAMQMNTTDGMKLTVGSQGLVMDVNTNDIFDTEKIVLHFKDGTQYCLEDWDQMILNSTGGLWRPSEAYDADELVILYNRLIDVDEVSSVEVTAAWVLRESEDENQEPISYQKTYVFYP